MPLDVSQHAFGRAFIPVAGILFQAVHEVGQHFGVRVEITRSSFATIHGGTVHTHQLAQVRQRRSFVATFILHRAFLGRYHRGVLDHLDTVGTFTLLLHHRLGFTPIDDRMRDRFVILQQIVGDIAIDDRRRYRRAVPLKGHEGHAQGEGQPQGQPAAHLLGGVVPGMSFACHVRVLLGRTLDGDVSLPVLRHQAEPFAVYIDDLHFRVGLQVLAQLGDVHVHAAAVEVIVVAPDLLQGQRPLEQAVAMQA